MNFKAVFMTQRYYQSGNLNTIKQRIPSSCDAEVYVSSPWDNCDVRVITCPFWSIGILGTYTIVCSDIGYRTLNVGLSL